MSDRQGEPLVGGEDLTVESLGGLFDSEIPVVPWPEMREHESSGASCGCGLACLSGGHEEALATLGRITQVGGFDDV